MTDPTSSVRRFTGTIDAISEWSGRIFAWLILPLVGGLAYEVFARYAFDAPTEWAYDLAYMLAGSLFMLGAAYTLRRGGHIRTDFLYDRLSIRGRAVIDTVGYLVCFFPALVFYLRAATDEAVRSWNLGERADSPWRPPLYPLKWMMCVAVALLLLQGVSELVKTVHALRRGEPYER